MGHTWREMDPAGAEEQDRNLSRLRAIRDEIRDISLSEFTVGDLVPICRIMGIKNSEYAPLLFPSDLAHLEKRIQEIKQKPPAQ